MLSPLPLWGRRFIAIFTTSDATLPMLQLWFAMPAHPALQFVKSSTAVFTGPSFGILVGFWGIRGVQDVENQICMPIPHLLP